MLSVSVVIPNYNGRDLLAQNLPTVYDALRASGIDDFEVIVADDASKDDSVLFLQTHYPQVILVRNNVNLGFSGNINSGIAKASKTLVLLLNSDVQLAPDYFAAQVAYFSRTDTFGVMGRIMSLDRNVTQDTAKYPTYRFAKIGSSKNYLPAQTNGDVYSWFLSGANALVCREKLNLLCGFREIFNPFYFEDVDLGLRAWRLGFKLYYEHSSVCYHPNSETIKKFPVRSVRRIVKRNQMMLHFLHLDGIECVFFLLKTLLKSVLYLVKFDSVFLSAFLRFLFHLRALKNEKMTFHSLQREKGSLRTLANVADFIKSTLSRS